MSPRTATKPQLSRSLVVDRVLQLADTEGLEAITVRRLAADLGVTPMALYWHFKTKDDLLDAAADAVFESITLDPGKGTWKARLRSMLVALTEALASHPQLAHRIAGRILWNESGRLLTEEALSALAAGGFAPPQAAQIASQALLMAISMVTDDAVDTSGCSTDEREAHIAVKLAGIAALPSETYPHLRAAGPSLVNCNDTDGYFALGIDVFVGGVAAIAPKK